MRRPLLTEALGYVKPELQIETSVVSEPKLAPGTVVREFASVRYQDDREEFVWGTSNWDPDEHLEDYYYEYIVE